MWNKQQFSVTILRLSFIVMVTLSVADVSAADTPEAKQPPLEQIIICFKTHFDIGYSDMAKNVVEEYRTTMIDHTLDVIDKNRGLPKGQQFIWTIPGWPMTQMFFGDQDPQRKKKIEQAFCNGSLVIHALPFTTHTETLELEDLVRGMGFSSRLARQYDLDLPRGAKMTDVPCHTWLLPTLLKHAGVDFLHIGANDASQVASVPSLFLWEGPDGSRLLTFFSHSYGTSLLPPKDWPYKTWMALLHTYDNVGPPKPEYVRQVLADIKQHAPHVKVRIGRLSDFADAVLSEKPDLPIVRGDMPDTWIHGPMSAPSGCKIARNIRPKITAAETLGAFLAVWGMNCPGLRDTISAAYEKSQLYGEHTWGLATQKYVKLPYGDAWDELLAKGLPADYQRCEESWDEHESYIKDAKSLVEPLLSRELQTLANNVNVDGRRIVVFNPLPWKQSDVVELQVADKTLVGLKSVDDGRSVPVSAYDGTIRFVATVPAMGYRTYIVAEKLQPSAEATVGTSNHTIESPFFKAKLDPVCGAIVSLIDKRSGRELVDTTGPHKFGQYLYERFGKKEVNEYLQAYVPPGWHKTHDVITTKADMPDAPYQAATAGNMNLKIQRSTIGVSAVMSMPANENLPQEVSIKLSLYNDLPVADLEVSVEKKPDGWPEAGWICLPLKINPPKFNLGRLGSIIDPTTDIIDGCNFHLLWLNSGLTVNDPSGAGVGICPIDSPLVSLGEPGVMRYSRHYIPKQAHVYINLFNNQWHTNFRSWWGGSLSSRVRLWSFDKYTASDALYQPAAEARTPLLAAESDAAAGSLPVVQSGLELSRGGVAVTTFGPNPDGSGTLLRLWEQAGRDGDCTVQLPKDVRISNIQLVDLRGRSIGEPIPVNNGMFTVPLQAFAPISIVFDSNK